MPSLEAYAATVRRVRALAETNSWLDHDREYITDLAGNDPEAPDWAVVAMTDSGGSNIIENVSQEVAEAIAAALNLANNLVHW